MILPSKINDIIYYLTNQFLNLTKFISGNPLITPPFISGTLEPDDTEIAKKILRDSKSWDNTSIIEQYEKNFAYWNGSKYAFSFMGGRVALSACIYAIGLKPGDEVILPGYTCVVVPNAFHFAGVKPVYSDIELDTYGLDASFIENKITSNTKAILLHHLYGLVCRDYEKIIHIAKKNNLKVIEDCAQSVGAFFKDKKVGNFGDVAFYSSEQSKGYTTIQGGIAVTNNNSYAERISRFHEKAGYPKNEIIKKLLYCVILNYNMYKSPQRWWKGDLLRLIHKNKILVSTTEAEINGAKPEYYGCKMPPPIAMIGLNQLRKIDKYNEIRRCMALKWDSWCEAKGYTKPLIIPESIPVYLRYPVLVDPSLKENRKWAYNELSVSLGIWFISNIHPGPYKLKDCKNAEIAVNQCINLPTLP